MAFESLEFDSIQDLSSDWIGQFTNFLFKMLEGLGLSVQDIADKDFSNAYIYFNWFTASLT